MLFALRLPFRLSLPKQRIGLVVGDAEEPGGEPARIFQLAEVLIGFEKHVLAQIECVFAVLKDAQKVIKDTLLPSGNEQVERLYISPLGFRNQVGILNRPKDQLSRSFPTDADCG